MQKFFNGTSGMSKILDCPHFPACKAYTEKVFSRRTPFVKRAKRGVKKLKENPPEGTNRPPCSPDCPLTTPPFVFES